MHSLRLSFFCAAFLGSHTIHSSPLLDRRATPSLVNRASPSDYPLGDPCPGEWKYLNFDPTKDADKTDLEKVHKAVCDDLPSLLKATPNSIGNNDAIFSRYFTVEDNEGDTTSEDDDIQPLGDVNAVFGQLDPSIGATDTMILDNLDFAQKCYTPDTDGLLGYTDIDPNEGGGNFQKTVLCGRTYDLPAISSLQPPFSAYPDDKIDTLARVVLHEMTHYYIVATGAGVLQITDAYNKDGLEAYGAARSHGLVDPQQDNDPGLADVNGDNYAWFAMDAYVSFTFSSNPDDAPKYFQNPPRY